MRKRSWSRAFLHAVIVAASATLLGMFADELVGTKQFNFDNPRLLMGTFVVTFIAKLSQWYVTHPIFEEDPAAAKRRAKRVKLEKKIRKKNNLRGVVVPPDDLGKNPPPQGPTPPPPNLPPECP